MYREAPHANTMSFHKQMLDLDPGKETNRIVAALRENAVNVMRRRGAVLGISGGVDSTVVLALCVRAFGADNVLAIMMPERESSPDSEGLAREAARQMGITPILEDITPALDGLGCYDRRDRAIRQVFSEFNGAEGYTVKIGLPQNLLDEDSLNAFSITIVDPVGNQKTRLLPPREFRDIMAASNLKQRTRMAILYYHAEQRNFAVIGTANKNEHDQGFFVKHGDGAVDIHAIVHLYKTQVYRLAEYLGVPEEIRKRPPTSDTYSAPSTQQEFFFRLPFEVMDLLWFAQERGAPIEEVAKAMNLTEEQVQRAHRDFTRKHRSTDYLRMAPVRLSS